MLLRFNNPFVFALFRTPYGNGLRHEHRALRGSLRGGGTELELALIELIDDLAHGCLIQIAEALRGPCACVEVATGEIAGGVVMKTGCPALEELAAVRKHAKITNPTAESSLRRRKARTGRLTVESVADLAIFIGSFGFSDLNEV